MNESCANCRFFRWREHPGRASSGECHRRSPQQGTFSPFVQIDQDEWCGEWQPKPQQHNERPEGKP